MHNSENRGHHCFVYLNPNRIPSLFNITTVYFLSVFFFFFFSEPLLVLIEYVPFGDLLGYLRKSRGLSDTYYKDPDIKPKTSLTSQQLMKFAWQIADGMSYLSSKRVRNAFSYWTFMFCVLLLAYCGIARYGRKLLTLTFSTMSCCDVQCCL